MKGGEGRENKRKKYIVMKREVKRERRTEVHIKKGGRGKAGSC